MNVKNTVILWTKSLNQNQFKSGKIAEITNEKSENYMSFVHLAATFVITRLTENGVIYC